MSESKEKNQRQGAPVKRSRVAEKLARFSEDIPATAGLNLSALKGDAQVPPTKALPVIPSTEE